MFFNRYLLKFIRGFYGKAGFISLIHLIDTLLGTVIMMCSAVFTHMLLYKKSVLIFSHINQVFILIGVCLVLKFILAAPKTKISEKLGVGIKDNIRASVMQKLFAAGPAYMNKKRTGDMTSMVTFRVDAVKNYYTAYFPIAVSTLINIILLLCFMFRLDWASGLTALIAALGMIFCPVLFAPVMKKHGLEEWKLHDRYLSECIDSLQGVTALKAFNANALQVKKIAKEGEHFRKATMAHLRITVWQGSFMQMFVLLGEALSVAVAALRFSQGKTGALTILYILYLSMACFFPMFKLIIAWHFGFDGFASSETIGQFLESPLDFSLYKAPRLNKADFYSYKELKEKIENEALPFWDDTVDVQFSKDIRFENVDFAYDKKEILHDISFTVKHGTTTALVGSSGSGKSTIVKLLAGFYLPAKGSIFIGDEKLNEENVEIIQNRISAVWQNPHIFFGSIEDNIRAGKKDASIAEIEKAAEEVNLHSLILSLPKGYKTSVGELGTRLSGGERQRLTIARARLRDAPILIFDEATSSLDSKNEKIILNNFEQLRKGRTSLVIAHRLSTARSADQIILIDNGRIKAKGTHEELVRDSELYRTIMGSQLKD